MAGIIRGTTKVAMDLDDPEMQKWLRESWAKKVEKGGAQQAADKRPRDDEGLVADVLGKKRVLEEAHRSVMGIGPRLPPFDTQAPPKLPFGMDDVYAEGVEKVDFSKLRRQKKEVDLAMHWQEVPLVNVFLEGALRFLVLNFLCYIDINVFSYFLIFYCICHSNCISALCFLKDNWYKHKA